MEGNRSLLVYLSLNLILGVGLLWWNYSFPELASLSDKYYKLWVFSSILAILAYLDKNIRILPAENMPLIGKASVPVVVAVSALVAVGLMYFQKTLTFSFIPLVAAGGERQLLNIGASSALIIFGWIIAVIETDAFARTGQNSIRELLAQLGVGDNNVALQVRAVLFGAFHFILGAVNIPLIVGAYVFSLVSGYLNWRLGGFLPELLIHVIFNSYVIGIIFQLPFYVWILPPVITLLMLTKYSRYVRAI